ncbi:membrane protein [Clavibacter sp. B3I6]|uniref:YihY/virulence factor BrkB family protein n=1 Tax=Clavibacter sp. B3I6 TaxID=3042268 RepID=UPI0027883355|nr:YihY/virulence factor BrkB family protein [Clavibacter sp. B3I6]MDQ0745668.1 membrane protein [Clavibacter sp. B3I6]
MPHRATRSDPDDADPQDALVEAALHRRQPIGRELGWYACRRAVYGFMKHRGIDAAASLTFYSTLSLIPAAVAVLSLIGLVGDTRAGVEGVFRVLTAVLGDPAVDVIRDPVEQLADGPRSGLAFGISALGALWTSAAYVTAFGRAMNRVQETEEGRPLVKYRALMLLVTIALLVVSVVMVGMLLLTDEGARALGQHLGLGDTTLVVWAVVKWPLLVVLLTGIIGVLYAATPNLRRRRVDLLTWGSLVAIVAWGLGTAGFVAYVTTIASYESTYGVLGAVIVLLLWLYIGNLSLVLGGELDVEILRARQLQAGIAAEQALRLPVRDTTRAERLARRRALLEDEGRRLREARVGSADDAREERRADAPPTLPEDDAREVRVRRRRGSARPSSRRSRRA